ncbi:SPOR domain-containing protein [Pricia sp. S334]|uniref:SPOR domain-containing protein n=1 Tax=Pricia mediterranea TaxID=3076079 RepID=A0ABU3L6T7_9FLAO|nr:SPOR domain-containing protein [Pricia sp. S334]MDT7829465.1 SPOR domain-containing protein [Pricia sp. S334]
MKRIVCLLYFAASAAFVQAQKGEVNIAQDQKISDLLAIYKTANESAAYYRIQVGFGSHDRAQEIKSKVEIDFPNLSSHIDFDSPTYRVRVGRFRDKLDAERKFREVRKKYPDAMLLQPKKSSR